MDIQKAASYGWGKGKYIVMFLRNLTSEEFRNHSWLDNNLSDKIDRVPMIYYMKIRERITRENKINGDIGIYHGHGDIRRQGVSLDTNPRFKERKGYREFIFKMVEHLGTKRENVFFMGDGIWDCIDGNLWNGAEAIGHKEIADLADFFHKEFVSKHKKEAKTGISATYEKLTPKEILRMEYDPRKVVDFQIE